MRLGTLAVPLAALVIFTGCATVPSGPNVVVLPGQGKPFEQFRADDYTCRTFATEQTGARPSDTATRTTVSGAAIGTLLGAAAGAALGAAGGSAGTGAAVGAGVGLLGGTAVGAGTAAPAAGTLQQRYDAAYMQCMYAKGHQIPVARGSAPAYASQPAVSPPPPPPPPAATPPNIPPPPAGTPPPPPR